MNLNKKSKKEQLFILGAMCVAFLEHFVFQVAVINPVKQ